MPLPHSRLIKDAPKNYLTLIERGERSGWILDVQADDDNRCGT
jgi:hypothetical protein